MNSATELKTWLTKVFPTFENEWEENEEVSSFHSVLLTFTPYFGIEINNFTKKQLKILSEFINKSVENTDDLENAISTCFLEHLNQINSAKILKPYLSKKAKEKFNA